MKPLHSRTGTALQRRLEAGRRDEGFVLIYVLLVTTIISMVVAGMLTVTTANIIPALHSQNTEAADEAAEAGIQAAIAWLNGSGSSCASANNQQCPNALIGAGGNGYSSGVFSLPSGQESYDFTFANSYVTDSSGDSYLRVSSLGKAGSGESAASQTLVADIQGVKGVLNYGYYSTYETMSAEALNSYYPHRTIDLASPAAYSAVNTNNAYTQSNLSLSSPTVVTWNGASSGSSSDSVCDDLWYSSPLNKTGQSRSATESSESLPAGADWSESGSIGLSGLTRFAPCQIAFSTGMKFNGSVYSVDAPLISKQTTSGAGPNFESTVNTAWSPASTPAAPSTTAAYHADPYAGASFAGNTPSTQANTLTFNSTFDPAAPTSACIFYGPTRVLLNGNGTATVTSPQTGTSTHQVLSTDTSCYSSVNAAGQYMVNYKTSGDGVLYVKNNDTPSAGFTSTGQRSTSTATGAGSASAGNTVFYLTSNTGAASAPDASATVAPNSSCSGAAATPVATCAWTEVGSGSPSSTYGWSTYSPKTKCATSQSATAAEEQTFNCEYSQTASGSYPPGASATVNATSQYSALQTVIGSSLTAGTLPTSCGTDTISTATTAELTCLLNSKLTVANTSGHAANYATPAQYDRQYIAAAGTPTVTTTSQSVGSAPTAPLSTDSLFTSTNGSAAQETKKVTTTTFTVDRQLATTCSLLNILSVCIGTWGFTSPGTQQFQVTLTQTAYTLSTPASAGVSYFPSMNDVTQYAIGTNTGNGPGDVYVQGDNSGSTNGLSILADNDAILTGNITTSDSSSMDIDALGNVRMYHPVSCADPTTADINATSPGFCPNDITGLYTGGLATSSGLSAAHPALQYTNMSSAITTVHAGLIAQGGATNSGGSILTENFDRGGALGTLTVNGGLYQLHRGALGTQWEIQSGFSTRATSGYSLSLNYASELSSPYIPAFSGGSTVRYWNVVSVSSGGT
jgi:Tfp pilus assembly protein PilX